MYRMSEADFPSPFLKTTDLCLTRTSCVQFFGELHLEFQPVEPQPQAPRYPVDCS